MPTSLVSTEVVLLGNSTELFPKNYGARFFMRVQKPVDYMHEKGNASLHSVQPYSGSGVLSPLLQHLHVMSVEHFSFCVHICIFI